MMKKWITLCLGAVVSFGTLSAQNIDQVYTKDGSIYEGFISVQDPGKYVTVKTEVATVFVEEAAISELLLKSVSCEELPVEMQSWMLDNYPELAEVEIASMKIDGRKHRNVIVLEKGASARWKLLFFESDVYELPWNTLLKTTKTRYAIRQSAGIRDIVVLKDGNRFEGQVLEQIIGKELRIRTLDNRVHNVNFGNIQSISSEKIDPNSSILMQAPLWDCVVLYNGTSITGFITERVMGQHLKILSREDQREHTVSLRSVKLYRKMPNTNQLMGDEDVHTNRVVVGRDRTVDAAEEVINAPADVESKPEQPAAKPKRRKINVATAEPEAVAPSTQVSVNVPAKEEPAAEEQKPKSKRKPVVTVAAQEEPAAAAPATPSRRPVVTATNSGEGFADAVGCRLNGEVVILNRIVVGKGGLNIVAEPVQNRVSMAEGVRVTMPNSVSVNALRVVKTVTRSAMYEDTTEPVSAPTFTMREANRSVIGFGFNEGNELGMIDLDITCEEPGIYVILPLLPNDECVAFEVY